MHGGDPSHRANSVTTVSEESNRVDCFALVSNSEGCLHVFEENERNSPEVIRCLATIQRFEDYFSECCTGSDTLRVYMLWWDRPENCAYINKTTVRCMLFISCKLVLLKEDLNPHYKYFALQFFTFAINLIGGIMCGSSIRAYNALADDMVDDMQLNPSELWSLFLCRLYDRELL